MQQQLGRHTENRAKTQVQELTIENEESRIGCICFLWRHWRFGVQADLPCTPGNDPARTLRHADLSKQGKQAVLSILEKGSFLGEQCLTGLPLRLSTATAIEPTTIVRIEKKSMVRLLHEEPEFSEFFTSYMLSHSLRVEEDLVDHLFNSSEKRLARILLLLAHVGKNANFEHVIPKISQDTLAEMVGTTRPRISFFMKKFKELGFVYRGDGLTVHSSLINIILND